MSFPLTKTLDPADYTELVDELSLVDRYFTTARPQHEARRWEYAMALRARRAWLQWDYEQHGHANRSHGHLIADVGGAGSPFRLIVGEDVGGPVRVIDPDEPPNFTLVQTLRWRSTMAHEVYCLSVLEHVDDLDQFLYHLSCLVAPGGLLFLTMDCQEHDGADERHFHWMRKRIFSLHTWWDLLYGGSRNLSTYQFYPLGPQDWGWHGAHVYDYSFASLALVKRR